MEVEKAYKIIAEFMGAYKRKNKYGYYRPVPNYTTSLDELVPVWEKIKMNWSASYIRFSIPSKKRRDCNMYKCSFEGIVFSNENGSTIQEAAAIATAKAILKIKESE
jgi:hypothetical protein